MKFSYYARLSKGDRAVYDRSDAIREVPLPHVPALVAIVDVLRQGLLRDDRVVVEAAAGKLARGVTELLGIEAVEVQVLAVRPALRGGELHGLYTRDGRGRPRIRVWMRTARLGRVVAFKTFLRTLLHEICHHLDFAKWRMRESFHTQGFFARESSLFKQLVPTDSGPADPDAVATGRAGR